MPRNIVFTPPAQGTGVNFFVPLQIGFRYHAVHIPFTRAGGGMGDINTIRLIANDRVLWELSGTQLNTLNLFDQKPTGTAALAANDHLCSLFIDRQGLLQRSQIEETALNTGVADAAGREIRTARIELVFGAAPTAMGQPYAEVGSPVLLDALGNPAGPGTVRYLTTQAYAPAGAGNFEFVNLPKGAGQYQAYNRLAFFDTGVNITQLQVQMNNTTLYDITRQQNIVAQNGYGVRTPQADLMVLDPSMQGFGGDVLSTLGNDGRPVASFRVISTVPGAGNITVLLDTLGPLQG